MMTNNSSINSNVWLDMTREFMDWYGKNIIKRWDPWRLFLMKGHFIMKFIPCIHRMLGIYWGAARLHPPKKKRGFCQLYIPWSPIESSQNLCPVRLETPLMFVALLLSPWESSWEISPASTGSVITVATGVELIHLELSKQPTWMGKPWEKRHVVTLTINGKLTKLTVPVVRFTQITPTHGSFGSVHIKTAPRDGPEIFAPRLVRRLGETCHDIDSDFTNKKSTNSAPTTSFHQECFFQAHFAMKTQSVPLV